MTSLIDNNIDGLIKRARQQKAVSDMVFMTAYPPRELPNPIDKYTVAVNNIGVKKSQVFVGDSIGTGRKGSLYEVLLILRTYAPRYTASFALLRETSLLTDALEAADTDGAIADVSLGEIVYDNAARTVYRDLRLTVCWLLGGEGSR